MARAWWVALGGVVLTLTACSSDPPAVQRPSPTAPPATETPAPTVPPSSTATAQSESAEEFVRRWFVEEAKFERSGNAAALTPMFRGCELCQRAVNRIEKVHASGGAVEFRGYTITTIRPAKRGTANQYLVHVTVGQTRVRDGAQSEWREVPGGPMLLLMTLDRNGAGEWQLQDFARTYE